MKKIIFTTLAVALTLAGCKPEEKEQLAPEIKITSGSEIAIPAEGGTVTVEYEITNPVEGATAVVSSPKISTGSHPSPQMTGLPFLKPLPMRQRQHAHPGSPSPTPGTEEKSRPGQMPFKPLPSTDTTTNSSSMYSPAHTTEICTAVTVLTTSTPASPTWSSSRAILSPVAHTISSICTPMPPRTATVPLCPQVHTHWMRLEAARQ